MEEARSEIKNLTSSDGHHDTIVHEHHQPAVTHHHVSPTQHEHVTAVKDHEVHQHHHHTSVLPVHERETLPEKHEHNRLPTEHREHHHGDSSAIKERLAKEAAQFKDASTTAPTQHTQSAKPDVHSEHIHHHIHETVQPIIQKETVQPTVVHTTQPIHEVHVNEPKHHAATALPAVSMADFKQHGGSLAGGLERTHRYEGQPGDNVAEHNVQQGTTRQGGVGQSSVDQNTRDNHTATVGTVGTTRADGIGNTARNENTQRTAGPHGDLGNKLDPRVDSDLDGSRTIGGDRTHEGRPGATTATAGAAGVGTGAAVSAESRHRTDGSGQMDPRVDSTATTRTTVTGGSTAASANGGMDVRTAQQPQGTTQGLAGPKPADARGTQSAGQQYADTHAGSKMDSGQGVGPTTGSNTTTVGPSHVDRETVSPTDQDKKPSLLDRLNPLKDTGSK